MKRRLTVMFIMVCMFMTSACSGKATQSDSQTTEVVINEKLLNISGNDADSMLEIFDQGGHIEAGEVNEDGTLSLYMSDEDLEFWKEKEESYLKDVNDRMQKEDPDYALEYDDAHDYIGLYYNQLANEADITVWITTSECYSALYQLFDHPDQDWYVSIEIYNSDTGKLVVSGDSNSSMSYDDEDWEATYTDEWKKDYPENTVFIDFSAEILSYFGQSRSSFEKFLESYSAYYLCVQPTDQAVSMAIDPDKMEDLISFNKQLMKDEQKYFASLYDGYKIVYSDDSTAIELWYDDQISDSDMATEAVEAFLLAVMDQCFNEQSGSDWSLNIKIYNAQTGELKKDETIPGQDLYIINQKGW